MSTVTMSSQANEFRQRGSAPKRSPSSNSSLPRPGSYSGGTPPAPPGNPRGSPVTVQRRAYSNGSASQPFAPTPARPSYASSSYNPNGGNYGGYGNNGYSNGLQSSNHSNGLGSSSHNSSYGSDDKYKKPKRKNSGGNPAGVFLAVAGVLLFLYSVFMTTMYFKKNASLRNVLKRLDQPDALAVIKKVEELERSLKRSETSRRNAEKNSENKYAQEVNRLERENKLIKDQHHEATQVHLVDAHDKIDKFSTRENAFMDQVGWLMDRTRRESKRLVLERYGFGPHKVEITYEVVKNDDEKNRYSFIIEMAPLELVPHAVHLFLDQVDHGLLDGTHFYLNGPHIVQSGPQPDWDKLEADTNHDEFRSGYGLDNHKAISRNAVKTIEKFERQHAAKNADRDYEEEYEHYHDDQYEPYYSAEEYYEEDKRTKDFQDMGLDSLAFPDYHRDFPHRPWTVGFTGRPGGPDWYINKVDNTQAHGPGGQPHHTLHEQGDSCFGTIVADGNGRSMLATHIYGSDIYGDSSEWHHFISHPIEIVHARILNKEPLLDRHIHLDHLHSQHRVYRAKKHDVGEKHMHDAGKPPLTIKTTEHRDGHHLPHVDGAAEA